MKTIYFLLILGVLCQSCNTITERPKSPEELKLELKLHEQSQPTRYLSAGESTMKPNRVKVREAGLFRDAEYETQGYYIEGKISNSATIAKFKDAVLRVSFYSQTETVIEEKEFVQYQFYEPQKSKSFRLHVYPPDAMDKFQVSLISAVPVN